MAVDKDTLDAMREIKDDILSHVDTRMDDANTRMDDIKDFTKEMVLVSGSLNRAKLFIHLDPMQDDVAEIKNVILPGIVGEVAIIKKETTVSRWAQRNPGRILIGVTTFIFAIIIASALLATRVSPKEMVEEMTPIEFKE